MFSFDFSNTLDFPGADVDTTAAQSERRFLRGYFDGRWKYARYFAPDDPNTPTSWEELVAHNDLELYDLESDPFEEVNLAADPEAAEELLADLWPRLEALLADEA